MVTQEITLDVDLITEFETTITAKQGDRRSRYVKVNLKKGGETWKLPTTAEVNFRALKPDGNMILNPEPVAEDGTITLELTEQALAVPGTVEADLCITEKTENGDRLSTVSFVVEVMRAPIGAQLKSTSEMLLLSAMIDKGNEMLGDYGTALEQLQAIQEDVGQKQAAAEETARRAAETLAEANRVLPEIQNAEQEANRQADRAGQYAEGSYRSAREAEQAAGQTKLDRQGTAADLLETGKLKEEARKQAEAAALSADRSEQAANTSGYMYFEIDGNGDLIYHKTEKVDADFRLEEGDLILYGN